MKMRDGEDTTAEVCADHVVRFSRRSSLTFTVKSSSRATRNVVKILDPDSLYT